MDQVRALLVAAEAPSSMRTTMMIFMDKCDHVADPHRPLFKQAAMYKRQKIKNSTFLGLCFLLIIFCFSSHVQSPSFLFASFSFCPPPPSIDREACSCLCFALVCERISENFNLNVLWVGVNFSENHTR